MARCAITSDVTRELLLESGHRCAVCGASMPLDRAHIVPWVKSRASTPDNLICLCANCHARADVEQWPEAVLKAYKEMPWVKRAFQHQMGEASKGERVKVSLEISGDYSDEKSKEILKNALAAFLDVAPEAVQIVSSGDRADESNG